MKKIVALMSIVFCIQSSFCTYGQYITGPDEVPLGGTGNFVAHVDEANEGDIIFWEWLVSGCSQCSIQGSGLSGATYLFNAIGNQDVEYTYTTEFAYGDILWKTVNVVNALASPVSLSPDPLTVKHSQLTARWNASPNASSYRLDVSTSITFSPSSTFVPGYSNRIVNTTSEIVSGLSPATTYYYRVRAVLATTVSANSSTISIKTATVAPVATGSTNLESTSFTANWQPVSGASSYRLDVSTSPLFSAFLTGYNDKPISGTSTSIADVIEKTTIYYRVRAINSDGIPSANSNTILANDFDQNYVRTIDVTVKGKTTPAQLESANLNERMISYNFFDGLGREMQTVVVKASPLQSDLVQPKSYDSYGREDKRYLPYTEGSDGWYKPNALKAVGATGTEEQQYRSGRQYNYYQPGGIIPQDQYPFAKTVFENSPLNRPLKKGSPGAAWQPDGVEDYGSADHTIKINHVSNISGEVLFWTYTNPTANFPLGLINASTQATPSYYEANKLYKIKTKDEQNNEIFEYKDKEGKVILKKVQAPGSQWAETYYIYDDFGNLATVLPPEAIKAVRKTPTSEYFNQTDAVKDDFLKRWAFRYCYDSRNRLTIKQVPGADPVFMVYDNRDRLVLTQDGNQRIGSPKYWTFTKYDDLNRPILTGVKDTIADVTQAVMQDVVNNYYASMATTKPWRKYGEKYVGIAASGNVHGYTNYSYPQVTTTNVLNVNNYLAATYYDNYSFRTDWLGTYTYLSDALSHTNLTGSYTQIATNLENRRVVGQVTGSKIKVLDGGAIGGYTWLKSITYYDDKYKVIQTQSDNYKGGVDRVSNLYDFAGKVLKSKVTHVEMDPSWQEMTSLKQDGNKLIATAGSSGARSKEVLAAGTNGWFEVTVTETTTSKTIGFNDSNSGGTSNSDLNYTFQLTNTTLNIQENTSIKATVSGIKAGDVLRMERVGTAITFRRNGQLISTSAITASTTALFIDSSFPAADITLAGIRSSFSTSTKSITRTLDYDHAGRLLRTWHQVDNGANILLAHNSYNELGQLVDKKLHSTVVAATDNKQSVDYRYNIRGWLTSMNNAALANDGTTNDDASDYFGMSLSYNTVDADLANVALYNGNIAAIKWSNYPGTGTTKQKGYIYTYDAMNRIVSSIFKEKTPSWAAAANNGFTETGYSYDLNGNILTMQRNDKRGTGWMDNLVYNYGAGAIQSNKLRKVEDKGDVYAGFIDGNPSLATDFNEATDDYRYDANGNMINDRNKGIGTSINDNVNITTYNSLNLPETVTKGGNTIRYIYDAMGRKLSQVVTFGTTQKQTDYAGEFTYENDVLQFVSHEEGRIVTTATKLIYTNSFDVVSADITTVGAATSVYTSNGQKYVRVTSSSATPGNGVLPIGGTFIVTAGDRYRIRTKGYRTTNAVSMQVKVGSMVLGNTTLPSNITNEGWVEQIVTIPTGSTTMQAGLVWGATVASGEIFYLNEFEIAKLITTIPEYQYNLKDHLGNVRLTFTTQTTTTSYMAGYEAANQSTESPNFKNYPTGGQINTQATNARTGTNSQLLNGGYTGQIGLTKSFSVMPGDVVSIQGYAKYGTPTTTATNYAGFVTSLLSAFSLPTPVAGETGTASSGVNTFGNWEIGALGNSNGTDPVKIFVSIILFDRNYNFIDVAYQASTASGAMMSKSYTVREPGFAYLYISNEHPYQMNTYFDDVTITHTPSAVIQMNDYYPFGLAFNSYNRENSVENNYKFNGKEEQTLLGLGWLDYGARMYMPEIGRWPKIDPKAELYFQITPYAYAANTPTNAIDPDGRLVIFINGQHGGTGGKVDYWQKKEYVTRYSSYSFLGQTVWSGNETRMEVTQDFASEVQDHFDDHSPARFYDGALGGWANTIESTFIPQADNLLSGDRYRMGKQQGEKDAAEIINSLARTGGVITESLKVVSHSMGGAYSKGFVQAIVDYAMAHPEACRGLKISQFDFDPLQAAQLSAIAGVHTEQYSHVKKPGRKGSMGWLANGKQGGLDDEQGKRDANSYTEDAEKADHSVMSFFNNIQNLSEGTYVFQNGRWVKE
jgi:RHS repeat-associated protein